MNFFDSIGAWWQDSVVDPFVATFITQDRYKMILEGLGNTLLITLFAAIIGIALGFIIAAVRTTHDLRKEELTKKKGLGSFLLKFFNGVCKLFLSQVVCCSYSRYNKAQSNTDYSSKQSD